MPESRPHTPTAQPLFDRISTGNREVDEILGGGFPLHSINIVMGQPGTGKTIFAEELVFHNATEDRPILYCSTLSEPLTKMVKYLQGFSFFKEERLGSSVVYEDLGADLASHGITAVSARIRQAIQTMSPHIIVIDSFKVIHDLSMGVLETRRMIYEVAGLLTAYATTVFLVGEYTKDDIPRLPEFAVADGIVELSRESRGARDERYLRVLKLRGSSYQEGAHAFVISKQGLNVFPRFVSPNVPPAYEPVHDRVSIGVTGLDAMLGGGVWRGGATLLAGPSGSGKTTIGLQFALHGAQQGESTLFANFQENPTQLERTIRALGAEPPDNEASELKLFYLSPVELHIDRIIVELFRRIERNRIRRLVIDAISDLALSADDPQRLHDYLYSLMQHLTVNNVTSLLTLEVPAVASVYTEIGRGPISPIADNVVFLGVGGDDQIRRTVRVLKTRRSASDHRVRELEIGPSGARVR